MRRRKTTVDRVLEEDALADNHTVSFVQMKDMPKNDEYYSASALT